MKRLWAALGWGAVAAAACGAPLPVVLTLPASPGGWTVGPDFVGLSFESSNLVAERDGRHLFAPENRQLVALFRAAGIGCLRVGGGTADYSRVPLPTHADIDALFGFAQAAEVRVIYTLRLLNGRIPDAVEAATYISRRYGDRLICFEIGNEPDWHAYHSAPGHPRDPRIFETAPDQPGSAYPSFLATWRTFAAAVRQAVPEARFTGPETGSDYPLPRTKNTDADGQSWTVRFAADEKGRVPLPFVTFHDYEGEDAKGVSLAEGLDAPLSRRWSEEFYPLVYHHALEPALALGLRYRLTECNDYTGGVDGASNAFVSALWALDYMHWQAAHGCIGVNFHNKKWLVTDTVYGTPDGTFHLNPKAYGLRAFALQGEGRTQAVALENPGNLNLHAYAMHGDKGLFVTVINREHGPGARGARVQLPELGSAETMFLTAPGGPPARTGITLGGSPIAPDGAWTGRWERVPATGGRPQILDVPPASAAIIRFP